MPFRVFQHLLTREDQMCALKNMHRLLDDEGVIVIDVFNPSIPLLADQCRQEEFSIVSRTLKDGTRIEQKERVRSVDYFRQTIAAEEIYYITPPNTATRRICSEYTVRYTFMDEMISILELAGYEINATYGDFEFTRFGKQTYPGEILIIASKARI